MKITCIFSLLFAFIMLCAIEAPAFEAEADGTEIAMDAQAMDQAQAIDESSETGAFEKNTFIFNETYCGVETILKHPFSIATIEGFKRYGHGYTASGFGWINTKKNKLL